MSDALAKRLVTDDLWQLLEPLIPPARVRPQGGGRNRADARAVFAAISFVLTSGSPWRGLPRVFGVTPATVHRRFGEWTSLRLWDRLHEQALHAFGEGPEVAWTRALAELSGARTGDEPTLGAARFPTAAAETSSRGVVISLRSGSGQAALLGSTHPAVAGHRATASQRK